MGERAFRILAVCTGNASRSPAVERILAARLGPAVAVESAGTAAATGRPIAAEMAALLEAEGIDTTGFAARPVTPEMLRAADLVLALAGENVAVLVELAPDVLDRTFTLTELARIVEAMPPGGITGETVTERLRALVGAAVRARAGGRRGPSATDDVPNPYRHGQAAYRRAFAAITQATGTIVGAARP